MSDKDERKSFVEKKEKDKAKCQYLAHIQPIDQLTQTELLSAQLKLRGSDRPVNMREQHHTNPLG